MSSSICVRHLVKSGIEKARIETDKIKDNLTIKLSSSSWIKTISNVNVEKEWNHSKCSFLPMTSLLNIIYNSRSKIPKMPEYLILSSLRVHLWWSRSFGPRMLFRELGVLSSTKISRSVPVKIHYLKNYEEAISAGLVVKGRDSLSKVCEFKSRRRILGGHLSYWFVVKLYYWVGKTENKRKRGRRWPIF